MKQLKDISVFRALVILSMMVTGLPVTAQTERRETPADSIQMMMARIDSLTRADSVITVEEIEPTQSVLIDSTKLVKPKRDWSTWRPDPKRALWLALVIPGGGQIYNRKYWKLPLIYGGFLGCIYALTWNNMMYKDYAQAYQDLMDNDPTTASYNKFLHLGVEINKSNEERYKEIFKNRKDKYRRWRDLSIFVMIGVYALSVIDAYVDASLSEFDISKDLSMSISPTIINSQTERNPFKGSALGLQCCITF